MIGASRYLPHLAISPVTVRHDLGDDLARTYGMPMVKSACGAEVVSTTATRRVDLVRCPACRAVTESARSAS